LQKVTTQPDEGKRRGREVGRERRRGKEGGRRLEIAGASPLHTLRE
jgi:hypothetical protein